MQNYMKTILAAVKSWVNGIVDETATALNERISVERPCMTQVTLTTANWDDSTRTQTVTVAGILADTTAQNIQINPVPTSMHYAIESGIYCSAQANDSLAFSCSVIPTENIVLNVVWQNVNYIS